MSAKFHFSPRENKAHEIKWREWGEEAFQEARQANKPVLLSLSAVWCHWCHVMDETSYSDQSVIDFINERYIPVRVDNDQRPDVNTRYNMGGWPTTAFLTPDGDILAGATYVPPDQMKEALPKVYTHFVSNREEISQKAVELRQSRRAAYELSKGEVTDAVFEDVLKSVMENYDPLYGGMGEAPKFPHVDSLDLLMYAHRRKNDPDLLHMARKTLESMYRGEVYDREWNGFFRYATRRDWSEPHYEKMLEDNAGLLHNACTLYRITGDEEHKRIAQGVVEYMGWKLTDPDKGFFYGSQDADEEFYKLDAEARKGHDEPYIDHTCYTAWNAQMISGYLEASWTLDRAEIRDAGLKALAFLESELRDAETGAMYRYHDGSGPQVVGLLADQSRTALAHLDAFEVTGEAAHFDRAMELAALLETHFRDEDSGGFWDIWDRAEEVGLLQDRQKSVQENAVCAELFLRLHHLTREERYLEIAKTTVAAFAAAYEKMGYFAAGYAKVADLLLHPPAEVNIVGAEASTAALHWAALSLPVPYRIVQLLDPQRDGERLAALSLPAEPSPAAYVCFGTMCSAPVTEADQLVETVHNMQQQTGPSQVVLGD